MYSMSDMFLQQYDSLPKKLQREVQDYVEIPGYGLDEVRS